MQSNPHLCQELLRFNQDWMGCPAAGDRFPVVLLCEDASETKGFLSMHI